MMAVRWLEKLETTIDDGRGDGTHADEQAALERRIAALERQVADLTEWLTAVGSDLTDHTTENTEGNRAMEKWKRELALSELFVIERVHLTDPSRATALLDEWREKYELGDEDEASLHLEALDTSIDRAVGEAIASGMDVEEVLRIGNEAIERAVERGKASEHGEHNG